MHLGFYFILHPSSENVQPCPVHARLGVGRKAAAVALHLALTQRRGAGPPRRPIRPHHA